MRVRQKDVTLGKHKTNRLEFGLGCGLGESFSDSLVGAAVDTVLNLCCHIPGKDWVYNPLGVVSATVVDMVLVVVVAASHHLDMS
jgi:hypothetical protein